MAAPTPAKIWRTRIDGWISLARATRNAATLRNQADWFDHVRARLTAVSEIDRAAMAADLRAALTDLGA